MLQKWNETVQEPKAGTISDDKALEVIELMAQGLRANDQILLKRSRRCCACSLLAGRCVVRSWRLER